MRNNWNELTGEVVYWALKSEGPYIENGGDGEMIVFMKLRRRVNQK